MRRVLQTLPHERPGELPAVLPYYVRGRSGLPALLRTTLADAPDQAVTGLAPPLLVLRGERDRPGAHNSPWTFPDLNARAVRGMVEPHA